MLTKNQINLLDKIKNMSKKTQQDGITTPSGFYKIEFIYSMLFSNHIKQEIENYFNNNPDNLISLQHASEKNKKENIYIYTEYKEQNKYLTIIHQYFENKK